jgi:hypothetical protein
VGVKVGTSVSVGDNIAVSVGMIIDCKFTFAGEHEEKINKTINKMDDFFILWSFANKKNKSKRY